MTARPDRSLFDRVVTPHLRSGPAQLYGVDDTDMDADDLRAALRWAILLEQQGRFPVVAANSRLI